MEQELLKQAHSNLIDAGDNDNDSESDPKSIDIFQHMKINLKCMDNNCHDNNRIAFYCIPCKISICHRCKYEFHKKHILVQKRQYELEEEFTDQIFAQLQECLTGHPLFANSDDLREELMRNVDDVIAKLEKKIYKFKKIKLQEIDLMFDNFQSNVRVLQEKIEEAKSTLKEYINKNKSFFNLRPINEEPSSKYPQANQDPANTVFLLNYDIINICHQRNKEISHVTKSLIEDFNNYKDLQYRQFESTLTSVDDFLFNTSINEEVEESNLCKETGKERYTHPNYSFIVNSDKLNDDHFKDIENRVAKYNGEIELFKKSIFDTVSKTGNLQEIQKQISIYEDIKETGVDGLFSKRKMNTVKNRRLLGEDGIITRSSYITKDDVKLNHRSLEKYFGYITLDLYGKHFRMATKELQSSHADLMIKIDPEEEETDFAKPIEGSNELIIYDRKKRQLTKKSLNLTKNPFGYTAFPFGCRSLLVGDKLYITGGKDENQTYPNVVIYDRKTQHLKRIMDLRSPRSYHTMIFSDVFETIIVLGGENNNTVEIFDPLTNRWQPLPPMNTPRANPIFYFDKPRGYFYSLFGIEGKIINESFSDVIEYFDLTDYHKGWVKLDYKNKSDINLRTLLGVFPIASDKILIYGGLTSRKPIRVLCIFNILKNEIAKVDKKLLEELRIEAKKKNSRRLSSIVSNLSIS